MLLRAMRRHLDDPERHQTAWQLPRAKLPVALLEPADYPPQGKPDIKIHQGQEPTNPKHDGRTAPDPQGADNVVGSLHFNAGFKQIMVTQRTVGKLSRCQSSCSLFSLPLNRNLERIASCFFLSITAFM